MIDSGIQAAGSDSEIQDGEPSILIIGVGAMASLFAARLAASGVRVSMLGHWSAALEALQQDGVCLLDPDGQRRFFSVQVSSDPQALAAGRGLGFRWVLVLVKSWQTGAIAPALPSCLHPRGVAVTLQNGLGNYETLAAVVGAESVAVGSTTLGAHLVAPGQVRLAGEGPVILGTHPRLACLVELLKQAGFEVRVSANLLELLWAKLVINAGINPLTALLEISNGEVLARPTARELLGSAVREAAAVAAAQGIVLPFSDPIAMVEAVARQTAHNRSSMLQDRLRQAPTEIDAICGAIVRAGERYGVPTPTNRILWLMVQALHSV